MLSAVATNQRANLLYETGFHRNSSRPLRLLSFNETSPLLAACAAHGFLGSHVITASPLLGRLTYWLEVHLKWTEAKRRTFLWSEKFKFEIIF